MDGLPEGGVSLGKDAISLFRLFPAGVEVVPGGLDLGGGAGCAGGLPNGETRKGGNGDEGSGKGVRRGVTAAVTGGRRHRIRRPSGWWRVRRRCGLPGRVRPRRRRSWKGGCSRRGCPGCWVGGRNYGERSIPRHGTQRRGAAQVLPCFDRPTSAEGIARASRAGSKTLDPLPSQTASALRRLATATASPTARPTHRASLPPHRVGTDSRNGPSRQHWEPVGLPWPARLVRIGRCPSPPKRGAFRSSSFLLLVPFCISLPRPTLISLSSRVSRALAERAPRCPQSCPKRAVAPATRQRLLVALPVLGACAEPVAEAGDEQPGSRATPSTTAPTPG